MSLQAIRAAMANPVESLRTEWVTRNPAYCRMKSLPAGRQVWERN